MATTGAVLFVRPSISAVAASSARSTGAAFLFALRDSSGQFTSGSGIAANRNLRNLKALKPHRSVPMVDKDGFISDAWDNYLQFVDKTFLNVSAGPTLPAVADSITYSQAQAIANEAVNAALSRQVTANAQSVQSITQVVQAAQLPGAQQIPPAKLQIDAPPVGDAGGGGE